METLTSLADRASGLGVALILLVLLGLRAVQRAQQDSGNNFDYADFFRDATGKLSMGSQITFLSFLVMAWALLYATMNLLKTPDDIDAMLKWYLFFGMVFAGTPQISKFIDILPTLLSIWKGVPQPAKQETVTVSASSSVTTETKP